MALQSHSHGLAHLVHLLETHAIHGLQWVYLLVDHVVDADLRLPSALLRGHRQVVRLVHGVLVLRFLGVQAIVLCVRVLHDLVHLNFVPHAWWRIRILEVVKRLLIRILLVNVVLRAPRSLAARI